MNELLRTPLGRLRLVSLAEGASYLALVGVAVPLKYAAGMPEAVRVMGRVHGLLFVLFVIALARFAVGLWPWPRIALALFAAMVPFGAFVLEHRLRARAGLTGAAAAPAARSRPGEDPPSARTPGSGRDRTSSG